MWWQPQLPLDKYTASIFLSAKAGEIWVFFDLRAFPCSIKRITYATTTEQYKCKLNIAIWFNKVFNAMQVFMLGISVA